MVVDLDAGGGGERRAGRRGVTTAGANFRSPKKATIVPIVTY